MALFKVLTSWRGHSAHSNQPHKALSLAQFLFCIFGSALIFSRTSNIRHSPLCGNSAYTSPAVPPAWGHGAIKFSLRHFQQRPTIFCVCPFSPFSLDFCTSKTAALRALSAGRPFSYSSCSLAARAHLRAQNAHSPASRALAAVRAAPAASPGGQ